jgi:hypothetical protein
MKAGKDKTPDPRHTPIRESIMTDYRNRFGLECTWDGSDARALDSFLKANPSWTVDQIGAMVLNRFHSDDINAARPRVWLPRLGDYADGPHNQYGRALLTASKPSAEAARQQRTNERIARIFLGANDGQGSLAAGGAAQDRTDGDRDRLLAGTAVEPN